MRQDIVLISNASMNIYPNNKLSDFRVRLPQPVALDPSYRVAITRISFTKSYFNFDHVTSDRKFWIIMSDTKEEYRPDQRSLAWCTVYGYLLPGYYSPETFVEMMNICMTDLKIDGTHKKKTDPKYSLKNGYLEVEPGIMTDSEGHEIRYEVNFDPETRKVLGVEASRRPVFLNQGWTDLYVYSDLVYPTVVGDQACELMTILDGQTEKPFGAHCCEVFEEPWYHPLAKLNFQDIHIYIRNDNGIAPNFKFGRVNLRLSFRKQDDIR